MRDRWRASDLYPAHIWPARIRRVALRLKALSGAGARQLDLTAGSELMSQLIHDVLPGSTPAAVLLDFPWRAEKTVVRLSDSRGYPTGYIKCAVQAVARRRLRNEYEILKQLPDEIGPRPLKYLSTAEQDVLLTSAVPGKSLRPGRSLPAEFGQFLSSLTMGETYSVAAHPWVLTVSRYATIPDEIIDALSGRAWSQVIVHGDLAPWNLFRNSSQTLTAIDWEYASLDGFPGIDLAQCTLQTGVLIYGLSPIAARRRVIAELLRFSDDVTPREAAGLVSVAAFELYHRALGEGYSASDPVQRWRRVVWEQPV